MEYLAYGAVGGTGLALAYWWSRTPAPPPAAPVVRPFSKLAVHADLPRLQLALAGRRLEALDAR